MKIKMTRPMPGMIDGRRTPAVGTVADVSPRVAKALIKAKVAELARTPKSEKKSESKDK